jgi:diamine N-acetyltransferase
MLALREITRDTVNPLIRLKVKDWQQNLVAPNAVTLAQAAYEPGSYVWGLWVEDQPVGLMAMVHPHQAAELDPQDDPDAAFLWRLMIAAEEQGKGYGLAAIEAARAQAHAWGLQRLAATVVDSENSNMAFYEHLGFHQTGKVIDGELHILCNVA